MSSPMDKVPFSNVSFENNMMDIIQRAKNDPLGFEEQIRNNNPKGYEMACQIRNSSNPRQAILQLAQQRGVNPNILRMFGII